VRGGQVNLTPSQFSGGSSRAFSGRGRWCYLPGPTAERQSTTAVNIFWECGQMEPRPASTIVVGAGPGLVSLYYPCPERGMVSMDAGDPLEADHLCRSCSIEGRMSALWHVATLRHSVCEETPRDPASLGPSVRVGGSTDLGEDS
jgi:hypothetical protein